MKSPAITILGAFPPPVTGASKNNQLLLDALETSQIPVRKIDVSASSWSHLRTPRYHVERIWANFKAIVRLTRRGGEVFYTVPDAGWGVWYTLIHVLIARIRFNRLVLHHRCYNYILLKSVGMACVTFVAGPRALHVFLCPKMADEFQTVYGSVQYMIVSNSHYVVDQARRTIANGRQPGNGKIRVGHLSNLCPEKGFYQVADTFDRIIEMGIDAELHLGGPIVDGSILPRLNKLKEMHGTKIVEHGPLHGVAKENFFRRLDVFLFPTQYIMESWGNVLYESFAAGVPVLAIRRGCSGGFVSDLRGATCAPEEDFIEFASTYIRHLDHTSTAFLKRTERILHSVIEEGVGSLEDYKQLINYLSEPRQSHS